MRLGHAVFYVKDVPLTVAFYQAACGLTLHVMKPSGQYAEMKTGQIPLFFGQTVLAFSDEALMRGIRPNRPDQSPAGAEISLIVDDVRKAYDRAIAAGAFSHFPPRRNDYGQGMKQDIAHIIDPYNGILIEFSTEFPMRRVTKIRKALLAVLGR